MSNITIIGTGYVGLVTGVCLAEIGHNITCIDIDSRKVDLLNQGKPTIYENNLEELLINNLNKKNIIFENNYKSVANADFVYVTVGTPEMENGEANTKYVYDAIEETIKFVKKNIVIIMKSTVPLGTNDEIDIFIKQKNLKHKIDIVSNPEFLAQGTAVNDTFNASRIVLGINNDRIIDKVKSVYLPFDQPILVMDRSSAEMVKYASNAFLALKISYINEIANLCDSIGANILDVTKGMSYDDRIGAKFLNAGLGYGGSCFPKDTKALVSTAKVFDKELLSIKSTIEINQNQKYILIDKAINRGYSLKDSTISILGLSFKPNTDDIREAPALYNIDKLLKNNNKIKVFDPMVNDKVKAIYGEKLEYYDNPIDCLRNSEICFIFTEWNEIKELKKSHFLDNMKEAVIFDGRNIFSKFIDDESLVYYGIGLGKK